VNPGLKTAISQRANGVPTPVCKQLQTGVSFYVVSKVLIIEDVASDVRRAGEVLDSMGVKDIEVKRNIQMALQDLNEALEENGTLPETIILDLNFGSDSGFEILRLWHSNAAFKKATKIVVWTAMGETEHKICRAFGVNSVVPKWEGTPALERALRNSIDPSVFIQSS
jgi:CheY-like chemotaxis protein